MRKVDLDKDAAAFHQSLNEPTRRRIKSSFVEQGWMQKIRHRTDTGNSMINNSPGLFEDRGSTAAGAAQRYVNIDLRRCQPLPKSVMKVTCNTSSLFVLHPHQPRRKSAQS